MWQNPPFLSSFKQAHQMILDLGRPFEGLLNVAIYGLLFLAAVTSLYPGSC